MPPSAEMDISDLERWADSGTRDMKRIGDHLFDVVDQGAKQLQATDHYQNRTGNLRRGTQAIRVDLASGVTVSLEMDEHYASYVVGRGFSSFWEVGRQIEQLLPSSIERYIESRLG